MRYVTAESDWKRRVDCGGCFMAIEEGDGQLPDSAVTADMEREGEAILTPWGVGGGSSYHSEDTI